MAPVEIPQPVIWLPVPSWEGLYEVSSAGQVRSLRSGVILKPQASGFRRRYRSVWLHRNGTRKQYELQVLVAWAHIGTRPPGLETRHLDGDPTNNRLSNLSYGTASQNQYDIVDHGRHHQANKTACDSGHPFDLANTYIRREGRTGRRACRTCNTDAVARYRARQKEKRENRSESA